MDLVEALAWTFGLILGILMLVGFFSIWSILAAIRDAARAISAQLDYLIKSKAVKGP